jgi:hypothetical protein
MTPQEALALLTDLTGKVSLTRSDHEKVSLAIAVLTAIVDATRKDA